MIGTLLKIPLKVVKLQLKLALLPARTALRMARRFANDETPSYAKPPSQTNYSAPPPEPSPNREDLEVAPSELMERFESGDDFVLIDVRQAQELANSGLIKGSLHIPTQDLPHRIDDLDKGRTTIVYCHLGSRSMDVAMFMREKGFMDVKSLGGGIVGWESDGGSVAEL